MILLKRKHFKKIYIFTKNTLSINIDKYTPNLITITHNQLECHFYAEQLKRSQILFMKIEFYFYEFFLFFFMFIFLFIIRIKNEMDFAFLIDILISYGKLINLFFHEFKNQPKPIYLSVPFVFMILSKAFFP